MPTPCLDQRVLRQFFLGELEGVELDRVAQHVEQCGCCVAILQTLREKDVLVELLRDSTAENEGPTEDLEALITRLSDLCPAASGSDTAVINPALLPALAGLEEATQEVYDFLGPPEAADEIGRIGLYRILKVLGIGGMGVVFQAEDQQLHRRVALKMLKPILAAGPSARRRFLREARAIAGLVHENIVSILHVAEDRGIPYLAMPLLDGETLEARLQREGQLPVADIVRIGREVALGLAAAHEGGIIHRDIKPSNIFLAAAGPVKILDFGLARAVSDEAHLTQSGLIVGTPAYMAPEQAHGEAQDPRCDLFSLGAVLYHMATGKTPFRGANTLGILRALEMSRPRPPHLVNSALSPALSRLILCLLAKAPPGRPPSARAVAADLEAIRDGRADLRPTSRQRWFRRVAAVLLLAAGVLFGFLLFRPAPLKAGLRFSPPHLFTTGRHPFGVNTADLNGDGHQDLVVTNHEDDTVSVFLAKGDGSFHPASTLKAGRFPRGVAVADINGNGKPDLLVANCGEPYEKPGTVCVFLDDGQGGFAEAVHYEVGPIPFSVGVGDFNHDGLSDLVVTAIGWSGVLGKEGGVFLLLGNGDGTFQPAVAIGSREFAHGIVEGDFNGDGKLDLAVTYSVRNIVGVLLGNGDGAFQSAREVAVNDTPSVLAASDFNGDGKLDLAVTSGQTGTVCVLLGNGDGTLQPPVVYGNLGRKTHGVVVGDLNQDGKLDLAVGSLEDNALVVLLGAGDGTFQKALRVPTGSSPTGLIAADFNRDGAPDLAVVNTTDNNVGVFLNLPQPAPESALGPPVPFATGLEPKGVEVGDFNRDGRLDLVVANALGNAVSVLLGSGEGTFRKAVDFDTAPGSLGVAVGDLDGDGHLDLAVANQTATEGNRGSVSVLLGKGDGTFHKAVHYTAGPHPIMVIVGDFNRDGKPDLAVCDNFHDGCVSILAGKGDGTFEPALAYPTGKHTVAMVAGDFNVDGKLDLAVTNQSSNTVSALLGEGGGAFRPAVDYPVGTRPASIATGDFNGDGHLDLAVTDSDEGKVFILRGVGDGGFRPGGEHSTGRKPSSVVAADLDGDGILDLAVSNSEDNNVGVLHGNGDGAFRAAVHFPAGSVPQRIAVADFNRDGRLDVVVTNRAGNRLSVLLNRPRPTR
jgi:serine/threonine protein kinase